MPEKITQTVEVEGEELEIEVDPTQHGFVPESTLQDRISKAVAKAQKGRVALDEITESDDVLDTLAQSDEALERLRERRPDLFKNGRPDEGDEPDTAKLEEKLEEQRKALVAKEVKPRDKKLDELSDKVERLTRDRVERDILRAFGETGVVEDRGVREMLRDNLMHKASYSAEHDETFLVDEDGDFIPSGDADTDLQFLTVDAWLEQRREDGEYGRWFGDKTKSGTDFGGPGGGEGTGGWRSKGKADMSDAEKRQAVSTLVEKHGRAEGRQKWTDWPLHK